MATPASPQPLDGMDNAYYHTAAAALPPGSPDLAAVARRLDLSGSGLAGVDNDYDEDAPPMELAPSPTAHAGVWPPAQHALLPQFPANESLAASAIAAAEESTASLRHLLGSPSTNTTADDDATALDGAAHLGPRFSAAFLQSHLAAGGGGATALPAPHPSSSAQRSPVRVQRRSVGSSAGRSIADARAAADGGTQPDGGGSAGWRRRSPDLADAQAGARGGSSTAQQQQQLLRSASPIIRAALDAVAELDLQQYQRQQQQQQAQGAWGSRGRLTTGGSARSARGVPAPASSSLPSAAASPGRLTGASPLSAARALLQEFSSSSPPSAASPTLSSKQRRLSPSAPSSHAVTASPSKPPSPPRLYGSGGGLYASAASPGTPPSASARSAHQAQNSNHQQQHSSSSQQLTSPVRGSARRAAALHAALSPSRYIASPLRVLAMTTASSPSGVSARAASASSSSSGSAFIGGSPAHLRSPRAGGGTPASPSLRRSPSTGIADVGAAYSLLLGGGGSGSPGGGGQLPSEHSILAALATMALGHSESASREEAAEAEAAAAAGAAGGDGAPDIYQDAAAGSLPSTAPAAPPHDGVQSGHTDAGHYDVVPLPPTSPLVTSKRYFAAGAVGTDGRGRGGPAGAAAAAAVGAAATAAAAAAASPVRPTSGIASAHGGGPRSSSTPPAGARHRRLTTASVEPASGGSIASARGLAGAGASVLRRLNPFSNGDEGRALPHCEAVPAGDAAKPAAAAPAALPSLLSALSSYPALSSKLPLSAAQSSVIRRVSALSELAVKLPGALLAQAVEAGAELAAVLDDSDDDDDDEGGDGSGSEAGGTAGRTSAAGRRRSGGGGVFGGLFGGGGGHSRAPPAAQGVSPAPTKPASAGGSGRSRSAAVSRYLSSPPASSSSLLRAGLSSPSASTSPAVFAADLGEPETVAGALAAAAAAASAVGSSPAPRSASLPRVVSPQLVARALAAVPLASPGATVAADVGQPSAAASPPPRPPARFARTPAGRAAALAAAAAAVQAAASPPAQRAAAPVAAAPVPAAAVAVGAPAPAAKRAAPRQGAAAAGVPPPPLPPPTLADRAQALVDGLLDIAGTLSSDVHADFGGAQLLSPAAAALRRRCCRRSAAVAAPPPLTAGAPPALNRCTRGRPSATSAL
jgi:hypothetical protein